MLLELRLEVDIDYVVLLFLFLFLLFLPGFFVLLSLLLSLLTILVVFADILALCCSLGFAILRPCGLLLSLFSFALFRKVLLFGSSCIFLLLLACLFTVVIWHGHLDALIGLRCANSLYVSDLTGCLGDANPLYVSDLT